MAIVFKVSPDTASPQTPAAVAAAASGDHTTLKYLDEHSRTEAGVWECEVCDWTPLAMGQRAEFFHVVHGTLVVKEDGRDPIEIATGMSAYSPPGWIGRYRVPERVTKSFVSFYPTTAHLRRSM